MARAIDSEGYEAAKDLVTELLRTSLTLQDLFVNLVEEIPEDAFPGEDPGEVLLEMISGSACEAARAAGDDKCREAAALIGAIRDRVVDHLRRAAEMGRSRGG